MERWDRGCLLATELRCGCFESRTCQNQTRSVGCYVSFSRYESEDGAATLTETLESFGGTPVW